MPPASVTGLYLTISVGGVTERRHLGGIQFNEHGTISQDPFDPALIAEARDALNGLTTVTVEPAAPTLGAVLEDVVTSFQSMEPLVAKKWTKDDIQAFKAAAATVYRYPVDLAQLLAPPPASYHDPNVVPQGLRILVSTEQPQGDALVSRMDIPPKLNQLRISGGNSSVVPSVIRSSLWLSVNEALTYDQSAFAQLQGRPLHLMERGRSGIPEESEKRFSADTAVRLRRLADQYSDYIRLIPTDGGNVAMWVINHESGTVMAVDETGRGGGSGRDVSGSRSVFDGNVQVGPCSFQLYKLQTLLFIAFTVCGVFETALGPRRSWFCVAIGVSGIAFTAAGIVDNWRTDQVDFSTGYSLIGGVEDGFDVVSLVNHARKSSVPEISLGNSTASLILDCMLQLLEICGPPTVPDYSYDRRTPKEPGNRRLP